MYCDCFRGQRYCDGCHCLDCSNVEAEETNAIAAARKAIIDRNPNAFKPRVTAEKSAHLTGCMCRKVRGSGCC